MSKKDHRAIGRRSQAYGAQFERLIELSCARYSNLGKAKIEKTPEPFRMIRRQGKNVIGFYEKKAQVDFAGTIKGGRSIVFEAKHTASTNFRFDRIARHQEIALEKHDALGAEAFILIAFRLKNFYKISWQEWLKLKNTIDKKSVNEKDLIDYKLDKARGLIDFLEG